MQFESGANREERDTSGSRQSPAHLLWCVQIFRSEKKDQVPTLEYILKCCNMATAKLG